MVRCCGASRSKELSRAMVVIRGSIEIHSLVSVVCLAPTAGVATNELSGRRRDPEHPASNLAKSGRRNRRPGRREAEDNPTHPYASVALAFQLIFPRLPRGMHFTAGLPDYVGFSAGPRATRREGRVAKAAGGSVHRRLEARGSRPP